MTWYSKLLLPNGLLATFSLAVVVKQKLLTSYAFISLKTKELVFLSPGNPLYHNGF